MCGIFGHVVAKGEKKKFNYPMFCTLGIHNDSRGGDSCGIFIDGEAEYGTTKDTKKFEDFFLGSKLLKETKEFSIALGHCRKASPGMGLEAEKAQPVVLKNSKSGETRFVMIHNGTIYNYKELAEKYIPKVPIDGLSDSQVMARIFFYKGYDALAEYRGGSVFFIVDYREEEPKILMFKGASKMSEYDKSKALTEERPFFLVEGKNELIFSSLSKYLPAFKPKKDVLTIQENCLIQYVDGKLKIVKEYDRSEMCQSKPYKAVKTTPVYTSSGSSGLGYSNFQSSDFYQRQYINYDENANLYNSCQKPLHGECNVERYGWVCLKPSGVTKKMWFFRGVSLKNEECYNLLVEYQKKTKESTTEFFKKHQNLIRFLSIDQLYFKNGALVRATGPYNYSLYSGILRAHFNNYKITYEKGKFQGKTYVYDPNEKAFCFLDSIIINEEITRLKKKLC